MFRERERVEFEEEDEKNEAERGLKTLDSGCEAHREPFILSWVPFFSFVRAFTDRGSGHKVSVEVLKNPLIMPLLEFY